MKRYGPCAKAPNGKQKSVPSFTNYWCKHCGVRMGRKGDRTHR